MAAASVRRAVPDGYIATSDEMVRPSPAVCMVTSRWAKKLTIIDTEAKKVVRQVAVGKSPHGVWTLRHAPR